MVHQSKMFVTEMDEAKMMRSATIYLLIQMSILKKHIEKR